MKRTALTLLHFFILSLAAAFADSVEPLLDGWVRHQSAPFNNACPYYIDNKVTTTTRCQVGCVATALESIVSYYGREVVLQQPLKAWSNPAFAIKDVPAGTRIDTQCILPDYGDGTAASVGMSQADYRRSVEAVAQLSFICGMAAHMNWGASSSGADISDLVDPLHDSFGWKTARVVDSYYYTPTQWRELLKNELRNGRPILYTGYTMGIGGHAFVVDGFNEEGLFHVNWGYGNSYYGNYYDITTLNPFVRHGEEQWNDVTQGFFCNQMALFLSPDEVDLSMADATALDRTGQEIVIESAQLQSPALAGKYTQLTVTLRNTSDKELCSPFEVFTNLTTESKADLFKKGDYAALFGVNLKPGERTTVTAHCTFNRTGSRKLHISPDDENVIYEKTISISTGSADALTFAEPTVTFTPSIDAEGTTAYDATLSVGVTNTASQRSGSLVTYGLMDESEVHDGDARHFDVVYLAAGKSTTSTVTYKGLEAGSTHLFIVRWPWDIRSQLTFTVPGLQTDLDTPSILSPAVVDGGTYDLMGRRAGQAQRGLIIHAGRKTIR